MYVLRQLATLKLRGTGLPKGGESPSLVLLSRHQLTVQTRIMSLLLVNTHQERI